MVRLSAQDWLKTSVEFEPGEPSRLGCVVTNHGWSDWSTQDIDPTAGRHVAFRVTRREADYLVEAALRPERALEPDPAGATAGRLRARAMPPAFTPAAPRRPGFAATFRSAAAAADGNRAENGASRPLPRRAHL